MGSVTSSAATSINLALKGQDLLVVVCRGLCFLKMDLSPSAPNP